MIQAPSCRPASSSAADRGGLQRAGSRVRSPFGRRSGSRTRTSALAGCRRQSATTTCASCPQACRLACAQATKNESMSEAMTLAPALHKAMASAPIPQVASLTLARGKRFKMCAARAFAAASELALDRPGAVMNRGNSLGNRDLERSLNWCSSAHRRASSGSSSACSLVAALSGSRSPLSSRNAACARSPKRGSEWHGLGCDMNENSDVEPRSLDSYFRRSRGNPLHSGRVTIVSVPASLHPESSPEGFE